MGWTFNEELNNEELKLRAMTEDSPVRSALWNRWTNNRIRPHTLVSASVIVVCFTALYFAPIASQSNSGSCSCQNVLRIHDY
jgi:hypothetical protein